MYVINTETDSNPSLNKPENTPEYCLKIENMRCIVLN